MFEAVLLGSRLIELGNCGIEFWMLVRHAGLQIILWRQTGAGPCEKRRFGRRLRVLRHTPTACRSSSGCARLMCSAASRSPPWSSSTTPATGTPCMRRCCTPSGTAGRRPISSFRSSSSSSASRSRSRREARALGAVLRRGAIIFGLGLFLAGFPFFNLATWRIPGVLQRIALCYVAAAAIARLTAPRDPDIAAICVGSLAVALIILVLCGADAVDAGTRRRRGRPDARRESRRLARSRADARSFVAAAWDPEGLLSTLPAIATTLMGVIAGQDIVAFARDLQRVAPASRDWWRGVRCRGTAVASMVSDQQEPVDELVRALHRRVRRAHARSLFAVVGRCARAGGCGTSEPFVALGRNAILLFVLSGLVARLHRRGDGRSSRAHQPEGLDLSHAVRPTRVPEKRIAALRPDQSRLVICAPGVAPSPAALLEGVGSDGRTSRLRLFRASEVRARAAAPV